MATFEVGLKLRHLNIQYSIHIHTDTHNSNINYTILFLFYPINYQLIYENWEVVIWRPKSGVSLAQMFFVTQERLFTVDRGLKHNLHLSFFGIFTQMTHKK